LTFCKSISFIEFVDAMSYGEKPRTSRQLTLAPALIKIFTRSTSPSGVIQTCWSILHFLISASARNGDAGWHFVDPLINAVVAPLNGVDPDFTR